MKNPLNDTHYEQPMKRLQDLFEHGWIVDSIGGNGNVNIHTHGIKTNFNHLDLQIVVPTGTIISLQLLRDLVDRIKNGEQFVTQKKYDDILSESDVYFVGKLEGNRKVLRMIIPDNQGFFPGEEGCQKYFDSQLSYNTAYECPRGFIEDKIKLRRPVQ